MIRVHVICEGQTEEMFIKELLVTPFLAKGILLLPSLIGKVGHKGGNFTFERLTTDVRNRLHTDSQSYCSTFFDYYGLPESFPGKKLANKTTTIADKSATIYTELQAALTAKLGANTIRRFIPFIQMYEFEALLFSDSKAFAEGIDNPELAPALQQIADAFDSPEHINDSPQTAPGKRIVKLMYDYEKPLMAEWEQRSEYLELVFLLPRSGAMDGDRVGNRDVSITSSATPKSRVSHNPPSKLVWIPSVKNVIYSATG